MSITAAQPATTPIPVQLSAPEFTAFLLPHLSMPKRGPKCKLGYHRVFNLILWVLYTGMQWKCLPVPHDTDGKPAIHYTTVYRVFAKWADDGSLWQAFVASVAHQSNSTSVSSMATGRTPWPKKGGWYWLFRPQAPKGRESHRHHRQPWVCLSACPSGSRQCNRYGTPSSGSASVEASGQRGRVGPQRRLPQPRWGL